MNRSVHIDMPALPPFPEFPTPEQNIREFQERLQEIDLILRTGTPTKGEMQQQVTQSISRYITSENGWTATLFGLWPNHLSIDIKPAFAFQSIFKEIADWWLSTVEDSVGCELVPVGLHSTQTPSVRRSSGPLEMLVSGTGKRHTAIQDQVRTQSDC